MKKMIFAAILGLATTHSKTTLAHEGHDKAPGAVTAPNGGSMKGTKSYFAEVVYSNGKVKIFVYDHDIKSLDSNSVKVTATVKFPKNSKQAVLTLSPSGTALEGNVVAKDVHRFTLNLTIAKDGKSEQVSFNIEP